MGQKKLRSDEQPPHEKSIANMPESQETEVITTDLGVSLHLDGEDGKISQTKIARAAYGAPDKPLKIGDVEIQCYVLEDGRRMLVQAGLLGALDISRGGGPTNPGGRLVSLLNSKGITSAEHPKLTETVLALRRPEPIIPPRGGRLMQGHEGTLLVDICDIVLDARTKRKLHTLQLPLAEQCERLMRGFAKVGIIALIDEATGYQEIRDRQALQKILEKYISDDKQPYVKMFPEEFYQEMFRILGWQWRGMKVPKPSYVGKLTDDWIYMRLAPGVREALRIRTPRNKKGQLKYKLHQHLTPEEGRRALAQHIFAVMAFEKVATDKRSMERLLNRAFPKFGSTIPMPLDDLDE